MRGPESGARNPEIEPGAFGGPFKDPIKTSEKPIGEMNIRGYAALIQETYYGCCSNRDKLRFNEQLNSFETIGIKPSNVQNLIEGVDEALKKLSEYFPRRVKAIRLYFGLDQPKDSKFMAFEKVGRILKDSREEKAITRNRARHLVEEGKRDLRHPQFIWEIKRRLQ